MLSSITKLPFFVLILCLGQMATAQTNCSGQITGRILNGKTEQPIPIASIQVLNSTIGAVSDENGKFILKNICESEVDFEVRFIGFKTLVHHHDFNDSDHVNNGHKIFLFPDETELESVVIEAEAIVGDIQSLSMKQLDRAVLATKTTQSLAAAINDIQGVSFTSVGSNVQLPIIHGLYGNRILIINNGVKHGFQNWGAEHAPEIDITSANSVSVLKGAAGVRYGPEALGGVVVLEGNPLRLSQPLSGSINSGYQTNGGGYFANANISAGGDEFSYNTGLGFRRIGDQSTPNYLLYNTGFEENSVNIGLRYKTDNWNFKAYYSYVDQNLGLLRPSVARSIKLFAQIVEADEPILSRDFSYEVSEPNQDTNHHIFTTEVDWNSNIGDFKLLLSQQVNNRLEFDVRRNANLPVINLTISTTDNRLEWYHPKFGGLEGSVGVQFFSQNNDNNPGTNVIPYIPNYNNYRYSLFAIESLQKGNNTFELGIRLDHENISARGREQNQDIFRNDFTYTNITGSLGLVRDLDFGWKLGTNIGTAWRAPNMAELYSFGQHGFRIEYGLWRYYSNNEGDLRTDRILTGADKEIKAEKSLKWIAELSHSNDISNISLTGYINYIDNFIFIRPGGLGSFFWGPGPFYIFDQANALFIGTDLTYDTKFSENLDGTFGASCLWSRNVERDESLIYQPPLNLSTRLTWNTPSFFGLDKSKITLKSNYIFRQFQAPRTVTPTELINDPDLINLESEIFDFKDVPEASFLSNLLWEWGKGQIGGQLEVRNMFDTSYRDYLNQMRLLLMSLEET